MSWARRASTTPTDRGAPWPRGGEVTLGGRRVEVERPRVRTADGEQEVRLQTYEHSPTGPAVGVVLERMLAGVSTRRYRRTQEPVG